jgi:hypothetical protein
MAIWKFIFIALIATLAISIPPQILADPAKDKPVKEKSPDADSPAGLDRVPPSSKGDVEPKNWGKLSEQDQKEAVEELRAFAAGAAGAVPERPLRPHDDGGNFLLYSDELDNIAARHLSRLDHVNSRLNELFGLPKTQTIWRGKALVFIFTQIEDYRAFEANKEGNIPGDSLAMTHCFGNGLVHIAYYAYPSQIKFDHLLVHECVHGFLHRYRSPVRIPSWANEGLADALASEEVPDAARANFISAYTRAELQKNSSPGDLFTAPQIKGWQYPIAESLTAWMIRKNPPGYLEFLNGMKDGQSCENSLRDHYGLKPAALFAEFAKEIKQKSAKG